MLRSTHADAAARRLVPMPVRGGLGAMLLVLAATAASAQTFYVDPSVATCSATAAGTEADPYCSITQAMAAHKGAGVTIIVKPGTYREQVSVGASGASGSPFVFQASGPGVVIDGSDDFRNPALWTLVGGSRYKAASVNWTPVQVFVNGARLKLAPDSLNMPTNTFRPTVTMGLLVNLGGGNPGSQQTFVGRRKYGFNMSAKSFVKVTGFEIIRPDDRGLQAQAGCADIEFSGNKVTFAGAYGIQMIGTVRGVIRGNTVSDAANHGIGLTAGATNCVVSDNESFRNVHPVNRVANGIYCYGSTNNRFTGNRLHDNQDTGLQFSGGANNNISVHNRSWKNGDHGYDHLASSGVHHVNDIAFQNKLDGFSFEGNSPGGSVHNSISVDNGIPGTTGRNLWVDAASAVGFTSDHNIFWNGWMNDPVKWINVSYATLAEYSAASGQDTHSKQLDPLFVNSVGADFHLGLGSPAVDMAHSGIANYPTLDLAGAPRVDVLGVVDTGEGPVTYADAGVFEANPIDRAPVVTAPQTINGLPLVPIQFTVTAMDPDNDPIASFFMEKTKLPSSNNATFLPSADNKSGTFKWTPGATNTGNWRVTFKAKNALTGSGDTKITIVAAMTEYGVEGAIGMPRVLAFSNGFPNPSQGDVDFTLDMPEAGDVDVAVFDAQGRVVHSESRYLPAGSHRVRWDGMMMGRQRAGTGIYFVRAKVGGEQFVRRVVRF